MLIVELPQIKQALTNIDILPEIEAGFAAYSSGKVIVPPVGELLFKDPPGDVHIKYGYIEGDDSYVIKIASGFYKNPEKGLNSSNGLMLLFDRHTGMTKAILLDEGYLTDIRTAAAGAIATKYLAPRQTHQIGIVGTGTQAYLQTLYLKPLTNCRKVFIWSRNAERRSLCQTALNEQGFTVTTTDDLEALASSCNLIITTTPSTIPLLKANAIKKGTHITAVGADSPHKQELDPQLFEKADIVAADSLQQCCERGDIAHAVRKGLLDKKNILELGSIILGQSQGRTHEDQITIADLTGLAVQDIQIAKRVYEIMADKKQ